eukprot:TRINITY_DN37045_c0_g1_i1.p1 TRINITY_DN37045_c0_g1~~TRINITY_DN37045_c0_g1_i1.p1  ORF type:complete len:270 (+),score=18.04 TRINITY_DN37045_c0_g1_i1:542-1351(+)
MRRHRLAAYHAGLPLSDAQRGRWRRRCRWSFGGEQAQRPAWRLHVHLPPLAREDPRAQLPAALRGLPLRWGGPYPTPLHLLHSVPLGLARPEHARQSEAFERMVDQPVGPNLWCSYADSSVVAAVGDKLAVGEARPEHFGGYVGMMCLEPGRLDHYMRTGHWMAVRPRSTSSSSISSCIPPQGWTSSLTQVWDDNGAWVDDRHWSPWRSILKSLGGEFADWADVDWLQSTQYVDPFGTQSRSARRTFMDELNTGSAEHHEHVSAAAAPA